MTLSDLKRALLIGTVSILAFWTWLLLVNLIMQLFIVPHNENTHTLQVIADLVGYLLPTVVLIVYFVKLAFLESPNHSRVSSFLLMIVCIALAILANFKPDIYWLNPQDYSDIFSRIAIFSIRAFIRDMVTCLICMTIFCTLKLLKLLTASLVFYLCIVSLSRLIMNIFILSLNWF